MYGPSYVRFMNGRGPSSSAVPSTSSPSYIYTLRDGKFENTYHTEFEGKINEVEFEQAMRELRDAIAKDPNGTTMQRLGMILLIAGLLGACVMLIMRDPWIFRGPGLGAGVLAGVVTMVWIYLRCVANGKKEATIEQLIAEQNRKYCENGLTWRYFTSEDKKSTTLYNIEITVENNPQVEAALSSSDNTEVNIPISSEQEPLLE